MWYRISTNNFNKLKKLTGLCLTGIEVSGTSFTGVKNYLENKQRHDQIMKYRKIYENTKV